MKVLVTGGAGFIGSHLVDKLISEGAKVVVIDNVSSDVNEQPFWNASASNHQIDVRAYPLTRHLYEGVDFVFHLAAQSRIQPAIDSPILSVQNNVDGTNVALKCAVEAGVSAFVYSSSSSVYGLNVAPQHEQMPVDCLNHYSMSKYAGELLCGVYNNLHGIKVASLRYFNVYGERQPLVGPYAPIVGLFKRQFDAGEPITIVGDGEQRRDFTHVSDVVRANIKAAQLICQYKTASPYLFNVGTGRNFSVNEVARMIASTSTRAVDPDMEYLPPRPGEARETLANIAKIDALMDWRPYIHLQDWINENRNNEACAS